MKKICILAVTAAFLTFVFPACESTSKKDTTKAEPEAAPANVDQDNVLSYLEKSAAEFRSMEEKRWKNVLKNLADSPEFLKDLKFDSTRPIDAQVAEHYIAEFNARNGDERRNVGGVIRVIKKTEGVWIDKSAIFDLLLTLIRDKSLDGIRVYFSQYPISASTHDGTLNEHVNGRKTLIFTATKDHVDHYTTAGAKSDGLYIYNYNSLCPDSCNGASLGGH